MVVVGGGGGGGGLSGLGLIGSGSAYEGLDQLSEYVRPPPPPLGSVAHVGNLLSRAGQLMMMMMIGNTA